MKRNMIKPFEMDAKTLEETLSTATPADFSTCYRVDWGTSRGQGKRVGGMVTGAMSSGPRGKKIYRKTFGKLPEEESSEISQYPAWDQVRYLRARGSGWGHEDAMYITLAYSEARENDTEPHEELLGIYKRNNLIT